jgi:hypothetical protein
MHLVEYTMELNVDFLQQNDMAANMQYLFSVVGYTQNKNHMV